jgi:pSer/pThr/pTyr-binding forkhead associated (FHA) protein/predicted amidophosphoribosyltransferase
MTSPTRPPLPPSSPVSPVKKACAFCGQENDEAAHFCSDCGKPITPATARVPAYAPEGAVASSMPADRAGVRGSADVPRMACRNCGKAADATLPYCGHCGIKLRPGADEKNCRNCAAPYTRGIDLFCNKCGTRVGERVSVVKHTSALIDARPSGPSISILDEGGDPSSTFSLDRGEAIIGRGDADIKFEFDVYLSPLHARIDLNDGILWLRDLGSRNGSWVFIDQPMKLIDGDLILLGSQIIRFRRLGYPGPHPPEADSTRRMGSVTPPVDVAILEQIRADGSVRDVFHLSPGRSMLMGRESGDWIFPYDPTMSGKHAEIVSEDIEFYISDAGSRNGVAMAVRGDRELKKNQRFLVGDQIMRVESV